eukprot:5283-Prymnesium_polylepis.1
MESVQATDPAPAKKLPPGARRAKPAAVPTAGYLFRYVKWQRRPDEWAPESFFFPWTAALAKMGTNRPPRKNMWSGGAPADAVGGPGLDEEGGAEKMEVDAGAPRARLRADRQRGGGCAAVGA